MQIQRVAKWSISLQLRYCSAIGRRPLSTKTTGTSHHINSNNENEWNDAWETAWLPNDLSGKNSRAAWESDVNFGLLDNADPDTKAFVEDMDTNWDQRRTNRTKENRHKHQDKVVESQRDYRLQKQRIHASLWSKEIQSLQEAKLAHGDGDASDDIDKLLDSCSEIFDSSPSSLGEEAEVPKNRPDGWETMSNTDEAVTVWDMSQREEDILLQEFERRMAFCKFQIASFIKTHIFSRRRPIDGWKYMIEVIGPNARKGKGSVSRLPSLADPATQPFTEDRRPGTSGRAGSRKAR